MAAGIRDNVSHMSDGGRGGTKYIQQAQQPKPTPTRPTGGRSGGSGDGGGAAQQTNNNANMAAYNALLAQYDDAFARSKARIDEAYNSGMANLASGYNNAANAYNSNLQSTLGILNDSYNASHGEVTTDAERSLREAYINNMMRRRDLNQSMSALGLNGGASESTMASISNQYGNARSQIEETKAKSLADLLRLRDSNIASAHQEYNSRMADLQNQRLQMENQLIANRLAAINQADQASAAARAQMAMFNTQQMNNALASSGGGNVLAALQALGDSAMTGLANIGGYNLNTESYKNYLKNLTDAQQGFTYDPTQAANVYNAASAQQAQAAQGTNYARYLQQLQQELAGGANPNAVRESLYRQVQSGNVAREDLASMLRQLGMA